VIFKPIEIVDFRRQLKEFGLPEQTIQHLSAVALDLREENVCRSGRCHRNHQWRRASAKVARFLRLPEGNHALLISCAPHKK
jgi:hypothetical protein